MPVPPECNCKCEETTDYITCGPEEEENDPTFVDAYLLETDADPTFVETYQVGRELTEEEMDRLRSTRGFRNTAQKQSQLEELRQAVQQEYSECGSPGHLGQLSSVGSPRPLGRPSTSQGFGPSTNLLRTVSQVNQQSIAGTSGDSQMIASSPVTSTQPFSREPTVHLSREPTVQYLDTQQIYMHQISRESTQQSWTEPLVSSQMAGSYVSSPVASPIIQSRLPSREAFDQAEPAPLDTIYTEASPLKSWISWLSTGMGSSGQDIEDSSPLAVPPLRTSAVASSGRHFGISAGRSQPFMPTVQETEVASDMRSPRLGFSPGRQAHVVSRFSSAQTVTPGNSIRFSAANSGHELRGHERSDMAMNAARRKPGVTFDLSGSESPEGSGTPLVPSTAQSFRTSCTVTPRTPMPGNAMDMPIALPPHRENTWPGAQGAALWRAPIGITAEVPVGGSMEMPHGGAEWNSCFPQSVDMSGACDQDEIDVSQVASNVAIPVTGIISINEGQPLSYERRTAAENRTGQLATQSMKSRISEMMSKVTETQERIEQNRLKQQALLNECPSMHAGIIEGPALQAARMEVAWETARIQLDNALVSSRSNSAHNSATVPPAVAG